MRRFKNIFAATAMSAAFILIIAGCVEAQDRNAKDVRDALRSLDTQIQNFEYELRYQLQSTSVSNSEVDRINDEIGGLRAQVQQFQNNFDQKRENANDVNRMIESAMVIEVFVRRGTTNRRIEDDWSAVKRQIDRIAVNYRIVPEWNEETPQNVRDYPAVSNNGSSVGLTGTYELDISRSERIDDILTAANLENNQREDLEDKLEAPAQIALDIRGDRVTLATSNASPITFAADGKDKVERAPNGDSIRLRASLTDQTLTISRLGKESDFTITFTSAGNGQIVKVLRRITTEYLAQTVFAESVYNKSDATALLGINGGNDDYTANSGYSDNDQPAVTTTNGNPTAVPGRTGNFIVPQGIVITGILENEINTKASQDNDRFSLTIQSPDDLRGATIEGHVSRVSRSGTVSGRPNVTFNFETIRLRNGMTYDFAGNLQSVTDQSGKPVKVDTEGSAQGGSQTSQTAKRGGIGAGLGALIGAIAGGGKGAIIGAVIGGGAGVGSVAITGRNDIQLQKGSTITVESSSPIR